MTDVRPVERMKHTRLHVWERRFYGAGLVVTILLAAEHLASKGSL